jgi:ERCC4-type nuclease
MIIKIDNRETTLIPLIEHRVEVFMNSNTDGFDLHEGVDDGIGDDGKVSAKKPKSRTSVVRNTSATNNGCLVPLHIFSDLEMNAEMTITTATQGNSEMANKNGAGGSGSNKHIIKKEQLAIGDIILVDDDTGQNIIIFERKTLYDLAASIRDGRYNEQSFRLDKENIHNHSIVYIIEGDIERYVEKRGRVSKKTLISSMFSLLYYKGFSVFRTNSICETADVIVFFADKYYKTCISDKSRLPYYRENDCHKSEADVSASAPVPVLSLSPTTKGGDDSDDNEKYCAALKSHKEKNEYITPDNINIIMLTCVPGISSKVATQLMREYKTIQNLLYQLEKKPDMLNTFMIKTEGASAKTTFRKINKTSVENIKKFLMTNAACAVSSSGYGFGST